VLSFTRDEQLPTPQKGAGEKVFFPFFGGGRLRGRITPP